MMNNTANEQPKPGPARGYPGSRMNEWKRVCALFVLCAFTMTNVVYAGPDMGRASLMAQDQASFASKVLLENPFGITFQESDGRVVSAYSPKSDLPLVLHLQDAHGNISAQTHVKNIIRQVLAKGTPKKVFCLVEGATGPVSRVPLQAFLRSGFDPRQALLEKGVISGPEFASTDQSQLIVVGIEDPALYQQNLEAWALADKNRPANESWILDFYDRARALLAQKSSSQLRELHKAQTILDRVDPDLEKVSKILLSFIKTYRYELLRKDASKPLSAIDLKLRFPNVFRFFQLSFLWKEAGRELEENFNQKQRETEALQTERLQKEKAPDVSAFSAEKVTASSASVESAGKTSEKNTRICSISE